MSFESYHYDGVAFDYFAEKYPYGDQPKKSDESKSENGVVKLTDSLIEDKLLDRIEELEKRIAKLENEQLAQFPPSYGLLGWCPTCKRPVSTIEAHCCPGPGVTYLGE